MYASFLMSERKEQEIHVGGDSGHRVVQYALLMSFGTMTSRVLGLVRDQLFAAIFPATVRDAWAAAFRLPNLFRRLLGEGSMAVSFIPVFVQARVDDPTEVRAKNLVNSFYTFLLLILTTLTTIGVLWPEIFLRLMLDPHYIQVAEKWNLTVRMARIMFGFIFFMSTYAYFMGIMNALGRYGLPAVAPTLFNVAMIISNLVPVNWLSSPGDAIAWGVVAGGILQMGVLIPSLWKMGYLPRLHWELNPDVLRILRNMLPGILGLGLQQATTIVNLRFASSLGDGPITYIWLADRLLELPLSLVSVSLGTALLPTLAFYWGRGEGQKMTETANYHFRLNLYVAIPAAVGLYVLSDPIIQVLFQRGHFTGEDSATTAMVLKIYSFILISTSCVRVLVPSYYAIKNTWLPAIVSGICLVSHVFLAPTLMKLYGLRGLVGSSFCTGTLNLLILLITYQWLIGPFHLSKVMKSLLRFALAGFFVFLVLQIYDPLLGLISDIRVSLGMASAPVSSGLSKEFDFLEKLMTLFTSVLLGIGTYILSSHFLRIEEYQSTVATVMKKIKEKFLT